MEAYIKKPEIRWSDMDPNFHLRHSAYYDFGALHRISFFTKNDITPQVMLQHNIGPILFREECIFKREIRFEDQIEINLQLLKCTRDVSRWTMVHEIWKNGDTLSAIITIDGAWIDLQKRKLGRPPEELVKAFALVPAHPAFAWID